MNHFLPTHYIKNFLKELGSLEEDQLNILSRIIKVYFLARKLRISSIADVMTKIYGNRRNKVKTKRCAANYKVIQRFLDSIEVSTLKDMLKKLLLNKAPFVIVDSTEIPRKEAHHTSYVGVLSDGKTRGFAIICVSVPYKGRAIPCYFNTYSY